MGVDQNPEKKLAKRPKLSNESRHEEVRICSLELHTVVERARETQKELTRAVAIKDFSKCTQLQQEYRQLQAERKKIEEKLVVLQEKQARHLKYVVRKARCETLSMWRSVRSSHWKTFAASLREEVPVQVLLIWIC